MTRQNETSFEELIRQTVSEVLSEVIQTPPINPNQYLRQHTKYFNSGDYEGRKVGQLIGMKVYKEPDGKDFRLYLVNKDQEVVASALFLNYRKAYKLKLITVGKELQGQGVGTKLVLKAMKLHPEIKLWSTGVLVSEAGMKLNKRLYDTGKVNMWLSNTAKGIGPKTKLVSVGEEFWSEPSRKSLRSPYGSKKRQEQEKAWNKEYRKTVWSQGGNRAELYFSLK